MNCNNTIREIGKFPLLKTIAFGGVATGNANPKEQAIVVGSAKYNGFNPMFVAYMFWKKLMKLRISSVNAGASLRENRLKSSNEMEIS